MTGRIKSADGYTDWATRTLVLESPDGSNNVISFSRDIGDDNSFQQYSLKPTPTPEPSPEPDPTPEPTPESTPIGESPNLLKATLRGSEITLQFDNTLSGTVPTPNRFTLYRGIREYQIIDTQIKPSEGLVTLTSEKKFDPTALLKLDYLDFAGDQTKGIVESSKGVDLESFTGFTLSNQGTQLNTLRIDDGEFEGNQITLFLSGPISVSIPSKNRFKVKSANKKQKILDVSTVPDDGLVVITTKKNLDMQKAVAVTYRDLTGDQISKVVEDLAGNDMATIKDYEIISGGNDTTRPVVTSATLDDNTLTVEIDSIIQNTSVSKKRFKVKVNGKRVAISSVDIEDGDSYLELQLKPKHLRTIDIDSAVTLAYKDSKGDQTSRIVEDLFGNDLESFESYSVDIVKI